jgi:hypothetical protein
MMFQKYAAIKAGIAFNAAISRNPALPVSLESKAIICVVSDKRFFDPILSPSVRMIFFNRENGSIRNALTAPELMRAHLMPFLKNRKRLLCLLSGE